MAQPSIRLIVFDKDGVLLDLERTWMPVVVAMAEYLVNRLDGKADRDALLAAVGVNITPGTNTGSIVENGAFAAGTFAEMRDIWAGMEPGLIPVFDDHARYRADILRISQETVRGKTVAKGNVRKALMELKDQGYALALATNDNTDSAHINLDDMGIRNLFDAIICADSGFGRKPEAGGLLECCRRCGCKPAEAVMIGDTATDWAAANNAGYKGFITIANGTMQKPEYIPETDAVLPSIEGLGEVIRRLFS
ncbi:HAD family hydrolase [Alphaproteobacteria bacterium LSUCC0684]